MQKVASNGSLKPDKDSSPAVLTKMKVPLAYLRCDFAVYVLFMNKARGFQFFSHMSPMLFHK